MVKLFTIHSSAVITKIKTHTRIVVVHGFGYFLGEEIKYHESGEMRSKECVRPADMNSFVEHCRWIRFEVESKFHENN